MVIAIDGNHCVGKTTIVNKLKEQYGNRLDVLFHKFPSYTHLGDFARQAVGKDSDYVLSLLFCADYYSVYENFIKPNKNKIMIFDRYILSLLTLQGYLKDKDYDFLLNICCRLPMPDIQIVITKKNSDNTVNFGQDPFVQVLNELDCFDNTKVFVVENLLNEKCENEDGYTRVFEIIESAITLLQ